jgi:xanthine dehydrogenase YagR molybdenum-binding subunit
VHADAPEVMDVTFVEEHDPHVNPLSVKGVGELAMVGVAPALTNAIYHATGKRIRELPVTPGSCFEARTSRRRAFGGTT